ncbi:MAG: hypothetical protein ACTTH8_04095 [Treponema sp.]
MKKAFMYLLLYSIVSAGFSAEIGIPLFTLGIRAGKQTDDSPYVIEHEARAGFRLTHGEHFYADLGIGLYAPDILALLQPQLDNRAAGQYAWCDFSLNFPEINNKQISAAVFSGKHATITGNRYVSEAFKHTMPPIRMQDSSFANCFFPSQPEEAVGLSFGGIISATSYLGATAGWNAHIDSQQEYGFYVQGGSCQDILLTRSWASIHVLEKAREISTSADISFWLYHGAPFSVLIQTGLDKTNVLSNTLYGDAVKNIYGFIEPRIELERKRFDFTIFFSALRGSAASIFPRTPFLNPYRRFINDHYAGLNAYCCFGNKEISKLEWGFHLLNGVNTKRIKETETFLLAVTPFLTANLGFADLNIQVQLYPLLYTDIASMIEGRITLQREL